MFKFLNSIKFLKYITCLVILYLFLACSPKLSYNVRSFIFDGVPEPTHVEVTVVKDTLPEKVTGNHKTQYLTKVVEVNKFNLHPPYQQHKCVKCHDKNSMGKTRQPMPQLCNQCHDDFNKKYAVVHGPVISGSCTKCHEPHKSKFKKLLVKENQKLCFSCHNAPRLLKKTIHKKIGTTSCTSCHNPHGGSTNLMLENGNCFKCHDSFDKKMKFLHGPVASENCAQCHSTHGSKTLHKLKISGNKLCLQCHNSKNIYESNTHKNKEKVSCIKCHNPHGGANTNFTTILKIE